MHVYLQVGAEDDPAAYFVTCLNATCVMSGHTLSAAHYPPPNLRIYLTPLEREDVVLVYVDLISQDSPQAAAAVLQISAAFGAPAALRAALILTIFRMELKHSHWIPDVSVYDYLFKDYAEALPLLEYALGCCLQAWSIHDLELAQLKLNNPASAEARKGLPRQ